MSAEQDPREDTGNGGNQLAWFLTGAVIGAAVAILYAPKSGKYTRQYLSQTAGQTQEKLAGAGDDVAEIARQMLEHGRRFVDEASELFERGRKLVRG